MSSKFILKKTSEGAAEEAIIAEYVFDGSLLTIGSDVAGTVVLPSAAAEQAVVIQERDHLTLINRADGTLLNNRRLRREAMEPLAAGDEIGIGGFTLSLQAAQRPPERLGEFAHALSKNSAPDVFATAEDVAVAHLAPVADFKRDTKIAERRDSKPEIPARKNARNFADVLNTLRTEEDSFYFVLENDGQEIRRIPLEQTEMPLGLDANGEITGKHGQIAHLYAILRKDWSGIVVEAQRADQVFVNGEALATTRRLRNGDFVSFNHKKPGDKFPARLKLHEPSSLIALESLLENRERTAISKNPAAANNLIIAEPENSAAAPNVHFLERQWFGYFNFLEIAAMLIGTLIGAVLIFLLLEFFVG